MVDVNWLEPLPRRADDPYDFLDVDHALHRRIDGVRHVLFTAAKAGRATAVETDDGDGGQALALGHAVRHEGALGFDTVLEVSGAVAGLTPGEIVAEGIARGDDGERIWRTLLSGDDTIRGNGVVDVVEGFDGDDLLSSGAYRGLLIGDAGDDVLNLKEAAIAIGGAGADTFVIDFFARPLQTGVRVDLVAGEDKAALDGDVFAGLGDALTDDNTVIGPRKGWAAEATASDRLFIDVFHSTSQGRPYYNGLYYDADGSGPGKPVFVVSLDMERPVTLADFVVIHGGGSAAFAGDADAPATGREAHALTTTAHPAEHMPHVHLV